MEVTLDEFLLQEQKKIGGATGDLTHLLKCVAKAVKTVDMAIKRSGLKYLQEQEVPHLRNFSNDIFITTLKNSHKTCALVSQETYIEVDAEHQGRYIVYFEPLDVNFAIDGTVSIGSIFGIARKSDHVPGESVKLRDVLLSGRRNMASGYAMYHSQTTTMVLTTGSGVNGFTLDASESVFHNSEGVFHLTDPDIRMKANGYGEYANIIAQRNLDYLMKVENPSNYLHNPCTRYTGSIIFDVHRMIKHGGVFTLPDPSSSVEENHLRLLYQLIPIAHIVEQAGGVAYNHSYDEPWYNGERNLLDIVPEDLHQRQPVMMGSRQVMKAYLHQYQEHQELNDIFKKEYGNCEKYEYWKIEPNDGLNLD